MHVKFIPEKVVGTIYEVSEKWHEHVPIIHTTDTSAHSNSYNKAQALTEEGEKDPDHRVEQLKQWHSSAIAQQVCLHTCSPLSPLTPPSDLAACCRMRTPTLQDQLRRCRQKAEKRKSYSVIITMLLELQYFLWHKSDVSNGFLLFVIFILSHLGSLHYSY